MAYLTDGNQAVLGSYRISVRASTLEYGASRSLLDFNAMESGVDLKVPGALQQGASIAAVAESQYELALLGEFDDKTSVPFVHWFAGGAAGSRVGMFRTTVQSVTYGSATNQIQTFNLELSPQNKIRIGWSLYNSVVEGNITVAKNGTGVNAGALPSGSTVYIGYQLINPPGVSGTTPELPGPVIETDVDDTWASPTTVTTLPVANTAPSGSEILAPGWTWVQLEADTIGAITDTWWRVTFSNPTGTDTPTFSPMVVMAIDTD